MQLAQSVTPGGVAVVRVSGDVDLGSCDQLHEVLVAELDADRHAIVVDLADVQFFDSTGLRTLDDCRVAAESRAGRLLLAGVRDVVLRLFRITGLCDAFEFYATAEDAAAAAGARP